MKELWILCLLTGGFLPGSSERLTPWVDFDSLQDEYRFSRNMSWWDAAYTGCDDVNGVLLPHSKISLKLFRKMFPGQYYWIGISEVYTPWKWTADHSFLFVNKGSLEVSGYGNNRTSLLANEPYLCHKQCNKGPVGLQGKYCYCLSTGMNLTNHVTDFHCPGAYSRYCGSEKTMSVYDIDIPNKVSFVHHDNAMCGYVHYHKKKKKLELKVDKNCTTAKNYACPKNAFDDFDERNCNGNVCVSRYREDWETAKTYCNDKLIKLSDDIMPDLLALTTSYYWKGFWIDLRRSTEWRWIHGYIGNFRTSAIYYLHPLRCITIRKGYSNRIQFSTKNCKTNLPSICQKYKPRTTTPTLTTTTRSSSTATSYTTSTTKSAEQTTSTTTKPVTSDAGSRWSRSTEGSLLTHSPDNSSESMKQTNRDKDSAGLTAGIVVGVFAVLGLAVIVVLVWMKRRGIYCFQSSKMTNPETVTSRVHTASARPSNDYELPGFTNSVYTDEQTYCTIQSDSALTSDKSNSPHAEKHQVDSPVYENNNVLHNHELTKPHVPRPATDTPGHQPNTARAENVHADNEYEMAAAAYSRPSTTTGNTDYELTDTENCRPDQTVTSPPEYFKLDAMTASEPPDYQLAGSPDGGQIDYQLAGSPDGGQIDYQLAGSPDGGQFDNELAGSNEGGPVAGSNDGGIYEYEEVDNAGFSDDYNTLHDAVRNVRDDGNYSHLGASQLTEDMYNTTQPQREHVENDVYSHVTGDTFVNEDEYSHMTGSHDVHAQNDPEYSHLGTQ